MMCVGEFYIYALYVGMQASYRYLSTNMHEVYTAQYIIVHQQTWVYIFEISNVLENF